MGRPNVGKSTLVNRLIGRREAVVQDVPGVTRDRIAYDASWNGRAFVVVDTGGWEIESGPRDSALAEPLATRVTEQARYAADTADVVLFVVDGRVGATEADRQVARVLRRSRPPVVLAATKVDDERSEADVAELWALGLGEPYPVSGMHGRGSGDLLDVVLSHLPDAPADSQGEQGPRRVALLGRPNVGKSSLLNRLAGHSRSVVDAAAGTTVDPVDSVVVVGGQPWRFVDTAGLRKLVHQAAGMEYYASLRTAAALDAAEVAIVLLDASVPLSEQDQRVINQVVEAGRALVIAFNKWDLLDPDRHDQLDREIDRDLARVSWAPRINVSAHTGRGVDKLAVALRTALAGWDRRVTTGALNSWLRDVVAATPPPPEGGRTARLLFATQADTRPPTFVLFTTGFLGAGYRRFLERRLREEFEFSGTPIRVSVRVRDKRTQRGGRHANTSAEIIT